MSLHRSLTLSLMLAVSLAGAACGGAPLPEQALDLGGLPASFEGELPCADCPGLLYHLDLQPGGDFLLRTTYRERPPAPDTLGRWTRSDDGRILRLDAGDAQPEQFAIGAGGVLTKLDGDGRRIESTLNDTLHRTPEFAPVDATALDATAWRLTHLGTERLVRADDARPVTLRFDEPAMRVTGSTGCNSLTGTYTREGAALAFGPAATTRMFCADDAALETGVLAALTGTASYRIAGNLLELRDTAGTRLALYTAD